MLNFIEAISQSKIITVGRDGVSTLHIWDLFHAYSTLQATEQPTP